MVLPFFSSVPTMTASSSRSWTKPAAAAAVVLALAGAGYASFFRSTPAPDVTFISIAGEKVSTEALRGKVVMVNFWATSCVTCVKEMPAMVDTYNKFKDQGLEFVAVAMQYDRPDYVLNFTEQRALPFKVALDSSGDLARQFGDVSLTPTTFLIDKQGNIIKKYVGEPDFATVHKLIAKELAG